MSLQDTIAADQTALEAAKHTVDMAQAQLDADVARLAVIQPQLDNFDAMVEVLKSTFTPMPDIPLTPLEVSMYALIAKGRALVGG